MLRFCPSLMVVAFEVRRYCHFVLTALQDAQAKNTDAVTELSSAHDKNALELHVNNQCRQVMIDSELCPE
jgi:hypothetical protein